MRNIYHVAKADFVQRVSSRRLFALLAVLIYCGYLVNVGEIELVYQHEVPTGQFNNYYGEPTAAFIGAKAAITGTFFLLFGGFYLLKNSLSRDRRYNVDQLVASTPTSDWEYLTGKWVSDLALSTVVISALGGATLINHAIHGIGPTNPFDLLFPLFVLGVPFGGLIGALSLLVETTERFDGTLGNILYFVLAMVIISQARVEGVLPEAIPLSIKLLDLTGLVATYDAMSDALRSVAPAYTGGTASFGQIYSGTTETYRWTGGGWPVWLYMQRFGLVLASLGLVRVAAVSFTRFKNSAGDSETSQLWRIISVLPLVGESTTASVEDPPTADEMSLTSVTERDAGGFVRIVGAELRLAVRGQRWWWYVGVVGFLLLGVVNISPHILREIFLPLAFVWPIFVWSDLGVRAARNRVIPLIMSSRRPLGQVLAEWMAGVLVASIVGLGVTASLVSAGHFDIILGFLGAVIFIPSLAVAAGIWSQSSRLFEIVYLVLWYIGPLNGVPPLDFLGVNPTSVSSNIPLLFAGFGIMALASAIYRRRREVR
ncbi:hypothetical protein ACFQL1_06930 [Halomicroarcula sp. GCM10025709]|uniref:hypothetical protein n=1 Tax=Haloarcula TaxID=2237 RepID=UPI0024C3AFB1|nr:hypothetical protein [Halomicroarcula sp. YJ-61-S]